MYKASTTNSSPCGERGVHVQKQRGGRLLLDHVGHAALAAVGTVSVVGHEHTRSTVGVGALLAKAGDLVLVTNLVELEDGQLDGLVLVGDALGGAVHLLLSLLGTSTKTEHQVQGGLLLDVVVRQATSILELLASEDQALLIRGNSYSTTKHKSTRVSIDAQTTRGGEMDGTHRFRRMHTRTHEHEILLHSQPNECNRAKNDQSRYNTPIIYLRTPKNAYGTIHSQETSTNALLRTFLVLDLGLDLLDGVARLDLEGNGLTSEGLDEDLHSCESASCLSQ